MHKSGVHLGCLVIALLPVTCAAAEDFTGLQRSATGTWLQRPV